MKGLVLLSGGLDSTVLACLAKEHCTSILALSFDYNQRHKKELQSASAIADFLGIEHVVISLPSFLLGNSSLTNSAASIHKDRSFEDIYSTTTPSTYVPARNTLFLAHALSLSESRGIEALYFGANAYDLSYPDCRPAYFETFNQLLQVGTKTGNIQIKTPFLSFSKKDIIEEGLRLKAPLALSWTCYDPAGNLHCGHCDACILRKKGFKEAGCFDPTEYVC